MIKIHSSTSQGFTSRTHSLLNRFQKPSLTRFQQRKISTIKSPRPADVGIIGGGAAGLSAAISALYEGYKVSIFESRQKTGGGFSNTPLIYNLPGYPVGISGNTLSQGAHQQALKLGAQCHYGKTIIGISKKNHIFVLKDQNGQLYEALKIILAIGVSYRKLDIPNAERLENAGIYYEAEDTLIRNSSKLPIVIYGAGNSAGQAAMFYRSDGSKVTLVYRGNDLKSSMSQYLIQRIQESKIKLIPNTEIIRADGNNWISKITIRNKTTNKEKSIYTRYLFAMIGGFPPKLPELDFAKINVDDRGYVMIKGANDFSTSEKGIYAAGDVTNIGAGRIILAQAQGTMAFMQAVRN